jgi:hypothetical protein
MFQNTTSTWATRQAKPYAQISTQKNRVKTYGENVYLADGQEFELELFNPSSTEVLAVVKLNGEAISESGLVIRPGERYWLERYLDKNARFKFSTYEVEDSTEAKAAIQDNGLVEVLFYSKKQMNFINPNNGYWYSSPGLAFRGSSGGYWENGLYTVGGSTQNINCTYSTDFSSELKSIETGRVAEGSQSEQSFTTVDMEFESMTCATSKFKILPLNTKPIYSKDLKIAQYCTDCGTKVKATWKFCATCGNKI